MKKYIKYSFIGLFVMFVTVINLTITKNIEANSDIWTVTCHYSSTGEYSGGTCNSGGDAPCECAGSIIKE